MKKKPTIRDVAARAGVSIATVSKYINSAQRFTPAVERRIRAAVDELAYQSNPLARSMITGRTGSVGVVILTSATFHQGREGRQPRALGAQPALRGHRGEPGARDEVAGGAVPSRGRPHLHAHARDQLPRAGHGKPVVFRPPRTRQPPLHRRGRAPRSCWGSSSSSAMGDRYVGFACATGQGRAWTHRLPGGAPEKPALRAARPRSPRAKARRPRCSRKNPDAVVCYNAVPSASGGGQDARDLTPRTSRSPASTTSPSANSPVRDSPPWTSRASTWARKACACCCT